MVKRHEFGCCEKFDQLKEQNHEEILSRLKHLENEDSEIPPLLSFIWDFIFGKCRFPDEWDIADIVKSKDKWGEKIWLISTRVLKRQKSYLQIYEQVW